MNLTELNVRGVASYADKDSERRGMGMGFTCPHCYLLFKAGKIAWPQRLVVWFANPIDGGPPQPPEPIPEGPPEAVKAAQMRNNRWQRTGEDLATISLSPSVDCEGHWHGFVTNGEIVGGV